MLRFWTAILLVLLGPGSVLAQTSSAILTIDRERLLSETRLGLRVTQGVEARIAAFQAENDQIQSELVAEEQELTELRPTMNPDEFRALADAFDEKVKRIRQEQDAKGRELTRARDEARQSFFVETADILGQIMEERAATVLLDTSTVLVAASRIDITDSAIQRINEALGDGFEHP